LLTAEVGINSAARDLFAQGKTLYQAEKFAEAARVWQQATSIFSQANDLVNQVTTLNNLSIAYQQLAQWQPAMDALEQS